MKGLRIRGLDDVVGFLEDASNCDGPVVIAMHGDAGIGKTTLLHHAADRLSGDSCKVAVVDLAKHSTPLLIGASVCDTIAPSLSWLTLTRFIHAEQALKMVQAGIEGREPSPEPTGSALQRIFHRITHSPKPIVVWGLSSRAVRRTLRELRSKDRRDRVDVLERLLGRSLAEDLVGRTRRLRPKRWKRVYLFFDNHERYAASLGPLSSGDFVMALARELEKLHALVTIVVARETKLPDDKSQGTPRIVNHPMKGLDDRHGRSVVAELTTDPAEPIVAYAKGNPRKLIFGALLGVPAASLPEAPLDHGVNPAQVRALLARLLARHSEDEQQALRLAAVPRTFDLPTLAAVLRRDVGLDWVHKEIERGTIVPADGSDRDGPRWQVEPYHRHLLRMDFENEGDAS